MNIARVLEDSGFSKCTRFGLEYLKLKHRLRNTLLGAGKGRGKWSPGVQGAGKGGVELQGSSGRPALDLLISLSIMTRIT